MEAMKRALPFAFALALIAFPAGHARADSNADFAAKLMAVMEQMATIVDANKNDCNAMGDKLDRFMTDNAAFFKDAKARAEKMSDQEKQQIEERYRARLQVVVAKLQGGITKCATNPKVVAAIQKAQQ